MAGNHDPIAFELFKNSIFAIADEMALTIVRTSYSGCVKSNMDFSTAVADGEGHLVAQGLTQPSHLGSLPTALAAVLERNRGSVQPGDVYILNDPFAGGMHLPDIFVLKPIFVGQECAAWACTVAHHTDVGGRVPGSNASDSTEIYQEGLRIPPLRLFQGGRPNEAVHTLIEANVRVPVSVFGDLRAQLAACHIGEKAFRELVQRHGLPQVRSWMNEILDYAERVARAAICKLPDGEFRFEDWIDDDGVDYGKPIRFVVTLKKHGDEIVADWTGTSPQVKGAINATLSFTKAATYAAIRSILPEGIPNSAGVHRAIKVIAPPGTIANVVPPGAVAARGLTGFRMVDCCFGALAQMVPQQVCAAGDGGATAVSIGGYYADRTPFIFVDFSAGTWGGRAWTDGLDGNSNLFANTAIQSAELTEAEHPLRVLSNDYVEDGGGAGKFRGGVPWRRDVELLEDEAVLQVRSDRRRFRPYGLQGGAEGKPSMNYVRTAGGGWEELPTKFTRAFRRGDVYRHECAGGGGWGDPLERDPAMVLRDTRNGMISPVSAAKDYGVVIDFSTWRVDEDATKAERARLRAQRTKQVSQSRGKHA